MKIISKGRTCDSCRDSKKSEGISEEVKPEVRASKSVKAVKKNYPEIYPESPPCSYCQSREWVGPHSKNRDGLRDWECRKCKKRVKKSDRLAWEKKLGINTRDNNLT